jgi:hypothetical protein
MKMMQNILMIGISERRPSASSNAERERHDDTDDRHHQRHQQAAPERRLHRLKPKLTGEQNEGEDGEDNQQIQRIFALVGQLGMAIGTSRLQSAEAR